ncbi:MAG: membrane integrity-associated transporter subunit PqiC [Alphaproteobacteria bacterium]|nr:membrane integrity-associated transporter subunit PqiC [Alphaproteobacteria bacterium]
MRLSFLVVIFVLAVASCTQPLVPKDNFYRLSLPSLEKHESPTLNGTIEVGLFSVNGVIGERAIIYTNNGSSLQQYNYHYWLKPPAYMLQEAMIDYLRKANTADRIVSSKIRIASDYILGGNVRKLEHNVKDSSITVEIELSLIRKEDNELIFIDTFSTKQRTKKAGVNAATIAIQKGLAEIFSAFIERLELEKP